MKFGPKNNREGGFDEKVEKSWASKIRNIKEETEGMSKEEVIRNYVDAMARHNVLQEENKEENQEAILKQKDRAMALAATHSSISSDKNIDDMISKREKEILSGK